jgi:hypothetical protein
MSFAKKCNRCGSVKENYIDSFKDVKEIEVNSCEMGRFPAPLATYHLCEDCYKEFQDKWLKGIKI